MTPKIDGGKWYDLKLKKSQEGNDSAPTFSANGQTSSEIPTDGWKNFPSIYIPPNLNYGHVYFYMVESVASAVEKIDTSDSSDDDDNLYNICDTVTAKPLQKVRNLLKSGFVENIQNNIDQLKHEYYVRANVRHSIKKLDP